MAGYILYNGFWNPDGPPDPVRRLEAAARERGRTLTPLPNTRAVVEFSGGIAVSGFDAEDFALFWDKDVRLGRALESIGVRLYNPAETVALCDDKAATHRKLAAQGIPMPRTLVAPMTYTRMDEGPSRPFLERAAERLGFPMVVKECYGSLGGEVYLARDAAELRALADRMDSRPFLCQEFIRETAGTDLRIYVVDGRPVAAMRRRSDGDFRANIGHGGHGEAYTPTEEEAALAVRCCRILGACFAGVDLLWEADGAPLVCEVNSNAHMAGLTACTGVDVAGEIVRYVFSQERQR
ncbi:MAG TPA: RimK family alpha-L-glutamate ligase [Firmicutes bacterium]|nr:RimK family alpha-L-glutamate ligase [Bacillota bacterium]